MQQVYICYAEIYTYAYAVNLVPVPGVTVKLNIIAEEPKSLIVEFIDVDRGIPELVREKLSEKKEIEYAGVVKEHPEVGNPRLIIKSSKNAKPLLVKALKEVEDELEEISSQMPRK